MDARTWTRKRVSISSSSKQRAWKHCGRCGWLWPPWILTGEREKLRFEAVDRNDCRVRVGVMAGGGTTPRRIFGSGPGTGSPESRFWRRWSAGNRLPRLFREYRRSIGRPIWRSGPHFSKVRRFDSTHGAAGVLWEDPAGNRPRRRQRAATRVLACPLPRSFR